MQRLRSFEIYLQVVKQAHEEAHGAKWKIGPDLLMKVIVRDVGPWVKMRISA